VNPELVHLEHSAGFRLPLSRLASPDMVSAPQPTGMLLPGQSTERIEEPEIAIDHCRHSSLRVNTRNVRNA
jgi:hypothetical protein